MRTFCISTLGCKVNQYESEQLATLLRSRGLIQVEQIEAADLRVVNTCSVTIQAASKSRQTVRQQVRLPVFGDCDIAHTITTPPSMKPTSAGRRVLVTGCWATSDKAEASKLPGVSAVLGHHDDVAEELDRLLTLWQTEDQKPPALQTRADTKLNEPRTKLLEDDGWIKLAGTSSLQSTANSKARRRENVKKNLAEKTVFLSTAIPGRGTTSLPQLDRHQDTHQRGFLKIQDGCDAHCTYCIIPSLRPWLWSKPVADAVDEARRLVDAGHSELILTGIFLGAYGQPTALRRRQEPGQPLPLAGLIEALCTRVPGLRRLRLSSLEPGDLTDDLLAVLVRHPQVVPHFHLPLQTGSDRLLRRMNRQYTRDDFLRMIDQVHGAFDRPAITTDIIVGFPGETDAEFQDTLDVVNRAGFIHIHAFPFSPRPGTAAARWTSDFVHGPVVNQRIEILHARATEYSLIFRQQFLGQTVELLVERDDAQASANLQHGRCERYFSVYFESAESLTGRPAKVRIDRVTPHRTFGTLVAP
jgi:threonylcarbamoyladenosine tRNA methylthiotransferase MtaB